MAASYSALRLNAKSLSSPRAAKHWAGLRQTMIEQQLQRDFDARLGDR
jgi:hypothetical protein